MTRTSQDHRRKLIDLLSLLVSFVKNCKAESQILKTKSEIKQRVIIAAEAGECEKVFFLAQFIFSVGRLFSLPCCRAYYFQIRSLCL